MEKQPESVRRFPSARGEWIRVGEKESQGSVKKCCRHQVKLVLVMPREVVMLRKHFDSMILVFARAEEDKRQEWDVTDSLNLSMWANRIATCRSGRHCFRSTSSAERKGLLGPRHRGWFVSE